ncbi:hypothetical protein ACWDU3_07025 [Streptomyces olivaceus]
MRVRVATTVLGITAGLLALPACSPETAGADQQTTSSSRTGKPADAHREPATLTSAALASRLLTEADLGSGYLAKPQRVTQHDDVTVLGCSALSELGGDAATGGTLTFPHKAKADFTYGNNSSEISEELYSDSPTKLSDGTNRIFDAMTGCPNYQVLAGSAPIDIATQKLPAPQDRGDERWSQLLTFTAQGRSTVLKQTAIRDGSLLLVVTGSPALVDRHLGMALTKATAAS